MTMKQLFLVLAACLFLSACGLSRDKKVNGPHLEIATRVDMGDFEGPRFKKFTKIPYQNTGTDTLYIQSCMPSCECVELVVSDEVIPPGGSGTITAYLDLTEKPLHTVEQPFFILSNDPEHHQIDVILVGTKK